MHRLESGVWWMSRQAIAAVLVRDDLASGERLVALSLASFAGRENRAWPGAPAACARARLSRSRYPGAERLVARGLVAMDERATGRGRASTVSLLFADAGPWWEGDINVELFESVLVFSRRAGLSACCSRRWLRSPMSEARSGTCRQSSCAPQRESRIGPTGVHARRSLRRARSSWSAAPVAAETRNVESPGSARGGDVPPRTPRRVAPPAGARPLVASAGPPLVRRRTRRRWRAKRAVRIGHFPLETVRS